MKLKTFARFCIALAVVAPLSALQNGSLTEHYRATADQIIQAALAGDEGWEKLTYLCDRIGNRLSGSESLEEAVRWAAGRMRQEGLSNVSTPDVQVPHWVRGKEWARIVSPVQRDLPMLGLGGSVATPSEGLVAEVAAVSSFEELAALGREKVEGKIVLYDVPWDGYRNTVAYRGRGASEAAKLGAVGALLRSVGPVSLQTPHTGALRYEDDVPQIPSAAITIEGSTLIHRLIQSGQTVKVHLYMEAKTLPDALSHNVIGEIVGSEKPEEVVVLGGHLDSWDVGQGAQDDGSGAVATWQAVTLIHKLGLRPRRTIRVVLWVNEENGLAGGRAYSGWVGDAVSNHVAAIEMDGGSEKPVGFGMSMPLEDVPGGREAVVEKMQQIAHLLDPIEAGKISWGGGGADIGPLMRQGVPGFGHRTVGEKYFYWHHTNADTLDKIAIDDFRKNTAMLAVLAYVLADMPQPLKEFVKSE